MFALKGNKLKIYSHTSRPKISKLHSQFSHTSHLTCQVLQVSNTYYLLLPRDPWQVGEGVSTSFRHSDDNQQFKTLSTTLFFLKITVRSCGGECNGAVSIVTWYTYKEGVRQTYTNRPSVKSSVCVNNGSLHCFNTHM
jgi:hypothetical protein